MLCCNLYWWKRTSVHCNYSFRRHRWFRLTKNWAWFISHVAGDGAAPSVLRMILMCCIIMYWIWRVISGGPFRGPLVPSQTMFRGGLSVFQGPGPLGPPRNSTTGSEVCLPDSATGTQLCRRYHQYASESAAARTPVDCSELHLLMLFFVQTLFRNFVINCWAL